MSASPTLLPLKFKWPEPDRSNIATHCCYFPGSEYIVKIRIFREREGKRERSHGAPHHRWGFTLVTNISTGPNSILYLPIYRSRYTSECLRKWFQNLLQITPSEMCSVFVGISCNTTNLCNITYSNFCQTNSQWFDRERKRQRTREWGRERERGGRGLIGFLWLQLNNIMHILA